VLIGLGLLACGSARHQGALGWSLGGEAHVFLADDHFARDFYDRLTGSTHLTDSLARRSLIPVPPGPQRSAQVFSASGSIPATLTLVRFHAPGTCGDVGIVTELVLAFPPGSGGTRPPASHNPVVAVLTEQTVTGGAGRVQRPLSRQSALGLLNSVAARAAANVGPLLRALVIDPDQAADAGEVAPSHRATASIQPGFSRVAATRRSSQRSGD
jgi:hypothetical protein